MSENSHYWYTVSTVSGTTATPAGSADAYTLAAVDTLAAAAASTSEIDLSWDLNVTDASAIQIYRSTDGSTFTFLAGASSGTATTYADTGLADNTTYYYKVRAVEGGADTSFAAPASDTTAAVVSGLTATPVSTSSIALAWALDGAASHIEIDRSTDGVAFTPITTTLSGTATSFTDTGLSEDVHYFYQVRALYASGTSSFSDADAWTSPIHAVNYTSTTNSITLTWANLSTTATAIEVDRSTDSSDWTTLTTTLPATATSYTDSGLSSATGYYYAVRAVEPDGPGTFTEPIAAYTLPNAPTGLMVANAYAAEIDLSWTNNAGSSASFVIQRSDDGGADFETVGVTSPGATSFNDTDPSLTPATTYQYAVFAEIGFGNVSAPATVSASTSASTAPTGLSATAASTSEIDLAWPNVDSSLSAVVQRSPAGADAWTTLATLAPGSPGSYRDTDPTLTPGSAYDYAVYSQSASGRASTPVTVLGATAPAAPTGLSAVAQSDGSIAVAFAPGAGDPDDFFVERSADGTNFAQVAEVNDGSNGYTDPAWDLTPGVSFTYRVRAADPYNDGSYSAYSGTATASAAEAMPTDFTASAASDSEIDLDWLADPSASINVQKSADDGASWQNIHLSPGTTTYSDTGLTAGAQYLCSVTAVSASGVASQPAPTQSAWTDPGTPTDLAAAAVSTSEIDLTWTSADSTSQILVQRLDSSGTPQTIATLPGGSASYHDTGLPEGTDQTYQIIATSPTGAAAQDIGDDGEPVSLTATTLPLAPTDLTGGEDSSGNVNLSWTDNSTNADGYEVLTSTDGVNFSEYDMLPAGATSYTDVSPNLGHLNYYEVQATAGDSESAPSNIFSLTPVAAPAAASNSFTVPHDQLLTGVVTSPSGGSLSILGTADGTPFTTAHGTVTLQANGSFGYTPNAHYVGPDSFSYVATDGSLVSEPATATISVTDQAPRASSNSGLTVNSNPTDPSSAGAPVVTAPFESGGLAATDADPGDSVTYSLVNADGSALTNGSGVPTPLGPVATGHGTVQLDSSGTYTPEAGFVGMDRFYYVASDGIMTSNVASISINVEAGVPIVSVPDILDTSGVGQPFTLIPAGGATGQGYSPLTGGGQNQNVDPSQFQVLTQPQNGSLSTDATTGALTYTANTTGLDSFTFGFGPDVPPSTALIDVGTGWDFTWGGLGGQTYTVGHGAVLNQVAAGGLLTGVQYSPGGTLSVNLLSGPASGTLTLGQDPDTDLNDGSFIYTPAPNATGWEYFSYDVQSSSGAVSPPATAAIDVTDTLLLLPLANGTVWTYQGQPQRVDPRLANVDADHPLSTLTAAIVSGMGPQHGTLAANGDGTFTYVPAAGYTGPDSFTYQISDGVTTSTHGVVSQSDDLDGNYETVFIDVRPLPVSLSIGSLAAGDPSATVVLDPTAATTSVLHVNVPSSLPAGSRVTLKLTSQTPDDTGSIGSTGEPQDLVQVFNPNPTGPDPDGQPPGPNGQLVLGSSATESAGDTVTWTAGAGPIPTQLLVSGNASGTVVFELDVTPGDNSGAAGGSQIFGTICLATATAASTVSATQPAAIGVGPTIQIWNGQYQNGARPVQDNLTVGAITVVNDNDTSGDGVIDSGPKSQVVKQVNRLVGRSEVDLMKLVLNPPSKPADDIMVLTVTGNVKLWRYPWKGILVTPVSPGEATYVFKSDKAVTIWVEAMDPSVSVRDISFTLSCDNQSDTAKATAIWLTSQMISTNETPAQAGTDPALGADWSTAGGSVYSSVAGAQGTGIGVTQNAAGGFTNVLVEKFTTMPNIMGDGEPLFPPQDMPKFEVCQQTDGSEYDWAYGAPGVLALLKSSPLQMSTAYSLHYPDQNEEPGARGVGQGPTFIATSQLSEYGDLWAVTSSSVKAPASGEEEANRVSFRDFVKTSFGAFAPDQVNSATGQPATLGSRCSPVDKWYSIGTAGDINTPNLIGAGNPAFGDEPIGTLIKPDPALPGTPPASTTTPGEIEHADMIGLVAAQLPGLSPRRIAAQLYASWAPGTPSWTLVDTSLPSGELLQGRTPGTQIGDTLAYTATGYYASTIEGDIVGPASWKTPLTSPVTFTQRLGTAWAQAASIPVTGTPAAEPSLSVTLAFGTVSPVIISNAFVPGADPATDPTLLLAAGLQSISIDVVTVGATPGARGQTLAQDFYDEVTMQMTDQLTGAATISTSPVWVIPGAAMKVNTLGGSQVLPVPRGPGSVPQLGPSGSANRQLFLGGDISGNIIGPAGAAGPTASLTWTWSGSATTLAPPVTVTAPPSYAAFIASHGPVAGGTPAGTITTTAPITVTAPVASVARLSAKSGGLIVPGVEVQLWAKSVSSLYPFDTLLDDTIYPQPVPPTGTFVGALISVPPPLLKIPTFSDSGKRIVGANGSARGARSVYYYDKAQGYTSGTIPITPL